MKLKSRLYMMGIVVLLGLSGCEDKINEDEYQVNADKDYVEISQGDTIEIMVLSNDKVLFNGRRHPEYYDDLEIGKIIRNPVNGTLTIDGKSIVYAHNGTTGTTDSFKYEAKLNANDDHTYIDETSVLITINQSENKPPRANAGEDKSVEVNKRITLKGSGTDLDGEIVSYEWKRGSKHLSNSATFIYTPQIVRIENLTFIVTDNDGGKARDTMRLEVTPIDDGEEDNTKPIANDSSFHMSVSCDIDDVVNFTLTGSDADGDTLTFSKTTDAVYGAVTVNNDGSGTFVLENVDDHNKCLDGMENGFRFKVYDGEEDSDEADVEIQN